VRDLEHGEFADFVSGRYSSLCRTAYLLTSNREAAEDAVQSALVKAFVHWSRVRRADHPEAYVRRIVINEVQSLRRRRWAREIVVDDTGRLPSATVQAGPEGAVLDRREMAVALASLTLRQRAVLVLRYYDGLSETEIAETLGIRPGSVKGHARAGLAKLGAFLGDSLREGTS
jgi:RNA polymerase sigma-70 factor (sigma-E family)